MAAPPNDSPSGLRRSAWPSSRVARSSWAASPRSTARVRTRRASSAAVSSSWLIRSADARRSWTSSSIAGSRIASARAASSVRPSSRSLVRRRTANASSRVASRTRRSAGVDDDGECLLDEPERLLGGVGGESGRGGIDREASRSGRVAGRERVLGEHRQAGGGRVATIQQQVDDRGVDLPTPGRRELVRGELADLLVGERVVGRLALGLREQEARRDGGRQIVGQRVGAVAGTPGLAGVGTPCAVAPWPAADVAPPIRVRIARRSRRLKLRPRIAASPSAARVPGGSRAARRSMSVRTADGTSRAALRAEPPLAVDLLEGAGLAVRAGQLLDDERHALGLDVHRGRGGRPRPDRRGRASGARRSRPS